MQRNCMSISLNRGEMCVSSLVWLCLGGPGRSDRPWRRWRSMGVTCELPKPPRAALAIPSHDGRVKRAVCGGSVHSACGPVSADAECAANEHLRATRRWSNAPWPPWHIRHAAPPQRTRESRDPAVSDWPVPQARVGWPGALWRAPHQEATERGR